MKFTVNGEEKLLKKTIKNLSLENFLIESNFQPQSVVVELNRKIIHPQSWKETFIKDGDNLEIVTIVGGGS